MGADPKPRKEMSADDWQGLGGCLILIAVVLFFGFMFFRTGRENWIANLQPHFTVFLKEFEYLDDKNTPNNSVQELTPAFLIVRRSGSPAKLSIDSNYCIELANEALAKSPAELGTLVILSDGHAYSSTQVAIFDVKTKRLVAKKIFTGHTRTVERKEGFRVIKIWKENVYDEPRREILEYLKNTGVPIQ